MSLQPHVRHLISATNIAEVICWLIFIGSVGMLLVGFGGR